jgi:hypothetical protein
VCATMLKLAHTWDSAPALHGVCRFRVRVGGVVLEEAAASINFKGHSAGVASPQPSGWPGRVSSMKMTRGDLWRCINAECGCEVHVVISSRTEGLTNPICVCGAVLKKPYVRPSIRKAGVSETGRLREMYALELT